MTPTILCMICSETLPNDEAYLDHMETAHKGKSQLEALNEEKSKKRDIPKIIPLDKEAPPSAEMQEVLQAIESAPKPEVKVELSPTPVFPNIGVGEIKPLKLKYVWDGNCPQCSAPVRTVITKVDGRWFVTAYCITHLEQAQEEVTPLEASKVFLRDKKSGEITEVKNGR